MTIPYNRTCKSNSDCETGHCVGIGLCCASATSSTLTNNKCCEAGNSGQCAKVACSGVDCLTDCYNNVCCDQGIVCGENCCTAEQICTNGQCCSQGETYVAGQCCPSGNVCGSDCGCPRGQACYDSQGCGVKCGTTTNSFTCPPNQQCIKKQRNEGGGSFIYVCE